MTTNGRNAVRLGLGEFREIVDAEFSFLTSDLGFEPPFFWKFAENLYVAFERGYLRVETWCGECESDVWTSVERWEPGDEGPIRRSIGLDTLEALQSGETEYPPSMGAFWDTDEPRSRLELEARLLHVYGTPVFHDNHAFFDEYAGVSGPPALRTDDPVATFSRDCVRRFEFLRAEHGLTPELVEMGLGVVFRGPDFGVRLTLLDTAYEHDEEPEPTLDVEVFPVRHGRVPRMWDEESIFLELAERRGPFSEAYLESAFDEAERAVRLHVERERKRPS